MTNAPTASASPDLDALAAAVREAERAKRPALADPPRTNPLLLRATAIAVQARAAALPYVKRHGVTAAAIVAAAGLGFGSGWAVTGGSAPKDVTRLASDRPLLMDWGMAAPLGIRQQQIDHARVSAELKAVSGRVAGLRQPADGLKDVKQEIATRLTPLTERLARLEKSVQEDGVRLSQGFERIAQSGAAQGGEAKAQIAQVLERLERIEKQVAAVQLASVPQPATTGSVPSPKANPAAEPEAKTPSEDKPRAERTVREEVVAGWVLRGVQRGSALVEGRRGVLEVRPGQTVPGVGKVTAIERRGAEWVVVTQSGLIAAHD